MNFKRLNTQIENMFNSNNIDQDFLNIQLRNDIADKLLDYQLFHVHNMVNCLLKNNTVIDGSSTGTGKTYTTLAICKQMKLSPLIICPKSIINVWYTICKYFDIQPIDIINYEAIRSCKTYDKNKKPIDSPYLTEVDGAYVWSELLPRNTVLIYDEAHKCKNNKSLNAKLLMSSKDKFKIMMLSATLSDTPENFNVFGYMLNFYPSIKKALGWINGMLRDDKNNFGKSKKTSALVNQLYPNKGSRMRIDELGDKFPKNQISADCYNLSPAEELNANKMLDIIKGSDTIKIKKSNEDSDDDNTKMVLVKIVSARMKLELYKIPIIVELAEKYLESNYSVVIFVNYLDTLEELSKLLLTKCIVKGTQSADEREIHIQSFQKNKSRIIICMMQAGGQSISLHDIHGKYPRVSIISPSYSSIDLVQSLGRICRAETKSPVLQRIVFCANTCEEIICNRIKEKLKFFTKLTDEDLITFT